MSESIGTWAGFEDDRLPFKPEASDIARGQLSRIAQRYLLRAHLLELQTERQHLEAELHDLHGEVKILRQDVESVKSLISGILSEPIRRTDRTGATNLLLEELGKHPPKESKVTLYKSGPSELQVSVVVPDDNYFEVLDSVLYLTAQIHKRYDLRTDITVYRKSETDYLPPNESERTIEY
jgi:hypothetical protein